MSQFQIVGLVVLILQIVLVAYIQFYLVGLNEVNYNVLLRNLNKQIFNVNSV